MSGGSLEFFLTISSLVILLLVHMGTLHDERNQRKQQALQHSLKQAQAALEDAAQHDVATGLLNRVGFEHTVRKTLSGDCSAVQNLVVLRLNLDGFKTVVETFGHDLGDMVVRFLAGRLIRLVREGDVLSRSDTGEYLLMCRGLAEDHLVAQLAQRLEKAIREPCLIQDHDIALSCSIGIACYPASTNADQLLSHSKDAMLTARKAGGGVYCFYERGMDRIGVEQIEMQRDLRHAIARNELALFFQPKLRADDNALSGVEALLRWTHPERGMVSPTLFIPVAERFGLIGELGLWVLNEACRQARAWRVRLPENPGIERFDDRWLGPQEQDVAWAVGDFAGWFEAYLGGSWHTFDPRNNTPRVGRVLIARGRDASDVAIATTFGPNTLESFKVWTDEEPD